MRDIKIISRTWYLGASRYALESSPLAEHYAEQMLDMQVAASPQSLKETRDCLRRLHEDTVEKAIAYEEQSHGFRRNAMYKGRSEAFMEFAHLLKAEIEVYERRAEANEKNDGRLDSDQS